MSLSLTTNVGALTARRYLDGAQSSLTSSLERLSSGQRINRAADDAAGLAISEKMRAQVGGLQQAARNAQDGVSLIQTAEGALAETHAMLQRMRTLAVQAASDTYTDSDRGKLTAEVVKLVDQIQLAATSTQFHGMALLDGSLRGGRYRSAPAWARRSPSTSTRPGRPHWDSSKPPWSRRRR